MKKKVKKFFKIKNDKGLHTRPATELVRCAQIFKSKIYLGYGVRRADAKSLLSILTLGAGPDVNLYVEAEGEDARAAVETIVSLANNNFRTTF
ncbi:MAG: HPr family phosphocarrier protein [Chlamydiota bacterium]